MAKLMCHCAVFIVVAAVKLSSFSSARTWNGTFVPYFGVRYTGAALGNYSVKSEVQCGLKCGIKRGCTAYNLGPIWLNASDGDGGGYTRSCELLSMVNGSVADITEEVGWTLMSSKVK